jgi:hypothetical protein
MIPVLMALLYYPQFKYWEMFSGDFFTYSYGNEGFKYWNSPKLINVLFSYQNGLFMYSPVLLFAMVGFYYLWKIAKDLAVISSSLFLLATYIFASWWAWWFGGAFGHRAFIEFLTLLAIPIAAFWQFTLRLSLKWKSIPLLVLVLLIYSSLKMTRMYNPPWDGLTWNWGRYFELWKTIIGLT